MTDGLKWGERRKMPDRRKGHTQKMTLGGHTVDIATEEYPDGSLGGISIRLRHSGIALQAMVDSFAAAVSLALQHGTPLALIVETFTYVRAEPNGLVEGHPHIQHALSIPDLVMRHLGIEYLRMHEQFASRPLCGSGEVVELQVMKNEGEK